MAFLLDGSWPKFSEHATAKVGILIGYGVSIECIQAFLPNRQFSFLDVVADVIGVIAYALVAYTVTTIRARSKMSSGT